MPQAAVRDGRLRSAASWQVSDLGAETAERRARGVTFEDYDLRGLKTVGGVAEWVGYAVSGSRRTKETPSV
jgi:hypothetical protein